MVSSMVSKMGQPGQAHAGGGGVVCIKLNGLEISVITQSLNILKFELTEVRTFENINA